MKKTHETTYCRCGHNMLIHNNIQGGCQWGKSVMIHKENCACKVQG